jgi:hypothetical protein
LIQQILDDFLDVYKLPLFWRRVFVVTSPISVPLRLLIAVIIMIMMALFLVVFRLFKNDWFTSLWEDGKNKR